MAGDIPLEPGARAQLWVQFSTNGGPFTSILFGSSDLSNIYRTFPIEMNNTELHATLNPGGTTSFAIRLLLTLVGGGLFAQGAAIVGMTLVPVGV